MDFIGILGALASLDKTLALVFVFLAFIGLAGYGLYCWFNPLMIRTLDQFERLCRSVERLETNLARTEDALRNLEMAVATTPLRRALKPKAKKSDRPA